MSARALLNRFRTRNACRSSMKKWPDADELPSRRKSHNQIGVIRSKLSPALYSPSAHPQGRVRPHLRDIIPAEHYAGAFPANRGMAAGPRSRRRDAAHSSAAPLDFSSRGGRDLFFRVLLALLQAKGLIGPQGILPAGEYLAEFAKYF